MAIKETTMYYLMCDNCGHMNDCDSDGFSYIYDNKIQANERLDDDNMVSVGDKHYCNGCYDRDKQEVIKTTNKN